MGNQLSVSILSALGDSSMKPVQHLPAKSTASMNSASPQTQQTQALLSPSVSEPAPAVANSDPATAVSDQPEAPKQELNLPRGENESQKPAPPRALFKSEPKTQAAATRKPEAKQETLQFEPVSRGRFEKSEPTIIDGQDLDVPTFLRQNVKVK